jgi:tRNA threonylcarbamoyladenosine biosynthesis protein TsaB
LITLAVDTSEARGSVALLQGGEVTGVRLHDTTVDYSEWLLPAVAELLSAFSLTMKDIDLLAVATGPGSFTGVRVGLTTVKAWAEVYGKRVVGVSRLEAMAHSFSTSEQSGLVAPFYDAQRGQLFAALYRSLFGRLTLVEAEQVISASALLEWAERQAAGEPVSWISLDPELITSLPVWQDRAAHSDTMEQCTAQLAVAIAHLAEERARAGLFGDPLELDANYVRRSDAEIFWKGR